MHQIKIDQFEGPLDLLLQLIEQEDLDITKVSLAKVTEQYLVHLQRVQERKPEELADFLQVAARLLLIKSKALLPYLQLAEEEEDEDLEKQLKIYKEYLEASKVIHGLIKKKNFSYAREKMPVVIEQGFNPPKNLTIQKLTSVFTVILGKLEPLTRLPQKILARTINIQEKINHIREQILQKATLGFDEILKSAKDRTEVIVSFLALLELVKQRVILVKQEGKFESITISRTSPE